MARYLALRDTWISHECRLVKEGQEFEAQFPEGMKLADNLQLVEPEKPASKKAKQDDLV